MPLEVHSALEATGSQGSGSSTEVDPDKLIKAELVRELCGGVTDMSIWRWLKDERVGFPRPVLIANKRYWFEAEVRNWIKTRRRTSKRDAG